jgi:hypothetical protein
MKFFVLEILGGFTNCLSMVHTHRP